MEKEKLQVYTARITQANKSELVVITYELILDSMRQAKEAFLQNDIQTYENELKRVQKLMNELMGGLNYQYIISYDLIQLYLYVNKRVITALMKRKPDTLDSAQKVMERLLIGFEGVAKEDHSSSLMENSQQLYAGLTYGKGTLNETLVNPNEYSRGYKA